MSPSRDHDNELLAECRELFDVPDDVAYFNVANLAPHLHSVRRAGDEALDKRGRPWTIEPADWFSDVERLRLLFGRILGTDAEGVALIPATSYGFAVAARNLHVEAGERIVVLARSTPRASHLAATRARDRWSWSRSRGRVRLDSDGDRCEQILDWDVERIAATLAQRTSQIASRARELGLAPLPDEQRGPHMLGIDLPEAARSSTLDALAANSCYAAIRSGSLRIAPHLHITDRDVESLFTGLGAATSPRT